MTQAKLTPVPTGDFPVGTILSFSGTLDLTVLQKAGWLYCNGDHISRTDYAGLFAVIGTANGDGDGSYTFNLPDLRGTFLRGVDGGSKNDPDAISRVSAAHGGNTGDHVGSVQRHIYDVNGGGDKESRAAYVSSYFIIKFAQV